MRNEDDINPDGNGENPAGQNAQVLHLMDFAGTRSEFALAEMRRYWQGLRRSGAVPLRADVRAEDFQRFLEFAFIVERIAPGVARIRQAGQHMIDLMGMEMRGMPLHSLMNRSARTRVTKMIETVFQTPQIAEFHLSDSSAGAEPRLAGRMLLMPLKSDLGDVTRGLGCIVSNGKTGLRPQRFDLLDTIVSPVIEGGRVEIPPAVPEPPDYRPAITTPPAQVQAKNSPPEPTVEGRRAMFRVISNEN